MKSQKGVVDTSYDTIYNRGGRKCLNGITHYTFRKKGCKPITIPKHEPIKKVYVEMVRQVVESEEKNNENA